MATTVRSAFVSLVSSVEAFFTANTIPATVSAGWREPWKKLNQAAGGASRVVFYPGDESGRGGRLGSPRQGVYNPRPLLTWEQLVTMQVWGVDTSDRDNELLQIAATEALFERAVQGVHRAIDPATGQPVGQAQIFWGDIAWIVDNTEMYFGRAIRVGFTLRTLYFDIEYGVATPQPVLNKQFVHP